MESNPGPSIHLGWMKRSDVSGIVDIGFERELLPSETTAIRRASFRLERANLPAMFSVVALAFESMRNVFLRQAGEPGPAFNQPAVRALMQYHLTAALAAFSYFRADMEKLALELSPSAADATRSEFADAHSSNRHWRLIAQLRNIDQHHPSALRHVTLTKQADGTDVRTTYWVNVETLISYARGVSSGSHLKQWGQLEDLWRGFSGDVDLFDSIEKALDCNYAITTKLILSLEDVLREDIHHYFGLIDEVSDRGAAILGELPEVGKPFSHSALDPRVAVLAAESVNEARKYLHLPPRFHVKKEGLAISILDVQ